MFIKGSTKALGEKPCYAGSEALSPTLLPDCIRRWPIPLFL